MIANIVRMLSLVVILTLLSACTGPMADLKVATEHDCADYMNAEWNGADQTILNRLKLSYYVDVTNIGSNTVNLGVWTLIDDLGKHPLPAQRLQPGATVRIWRGIGQSDASNIYLNEAVPAWTTGGSVQMGSALILEYKDFFRFQMYLTSCSVEAFLIQRWMGSSSPTITPAPRPKEVRFE